MSGADTELVRVVGYPSEAEAREAATVLLEHGIGPEVMREQDSDSNILTGSGAVHAVHVLSPDLDRAREVLGLVPTRPDVGGDGTEPARGARDPGDPSSDAGPSGATASSAEESGDTEVIHSFFGGRLQLSTRQVWRIALIYLAAFIVIPALFYFGTQWVTTPEVDTPDPTVRQSPVFTIG